jgi:uncharacterized membrane protein
MAPADIRAETFTDGPEASLARVVRRLRLPYSRAFVARRVAAHEHSQSLLAVVEVAPSVGLKVTPAEVEDAALEELPLPLIVHFQSAHGGGFGVLEKVTPRGFETWDATNGRRTIPRDVFRAHWTGVVGLVERRARGDAVREPHHLRNRLSESIFGTAQPLGMTGMGASGLRVLVAAVLATLVTMALADGAGDERVPGAIVALLAAAGLGVAVVAALATSSQSNPLSARICARGRLVDCHSVLTSQYSRVFGIPLSDVGIAFFGAILMVLASTAATGPRPETWGVVGVAFAASVPLSLALIAVQVKMRRLCTLCLGVHVVVLSSTALLWTTLRPARWAALPVTSTALLFALFFLVALFLAVPYFRKAQGLELVSGMHRRISGSPYASLAGLVTETPSGVRGAEVGIALGANAAPHELIALVHPSCNRCTPVMQEVAALARSGLVDAFVGLVPKDPTDADRDACAAVVAAGAALGPDRLYDAYTAAKQNLAAMTTGDPVQVLAAELQARGEDLHSAFGEARARVEQSEKLVDVHADGTPALFFDGRLYRGPLAHLATLLTNHAAVLEPLRLDGERTEGRVARA